MPFRPTVKTGFHLRIMQGRLGMVQYRCVQYAEAVATLKKAIDKHLAKDPEELAYLAMTYVAHGQADAARVTISQAKRVLDNLKQPDTDPRRDIKKAAYREAEALVLDAGFPKNPISP